MKKKSMALRLGVVALALTMATTSLSSGTLAKYISQESASATFRVAKWNVGVGFSYKNTKGETVTASDTFNLWQTMAAQRTAYDAETSSDVTKKLAGIASAGDAEKGKLVASGTVAPGTEGYFAIDVTNAAHVYEANTTNAVVGADGEITEVAVRYTAYLRAKRTVKSDEDDTRTNGIIPAHFKMIRGTVKTGTSVVEYKDENQFYFSDVAPGDDEDEDVQKAWDPDYGYKITSGTWQAGKKGEDTINVKWVWPFDAAAEAGTDANDEDRIAYDEQDVKDGTRFKNLTGETINEDAVLPAQVRQLGAGDIPLEVIVVFEQVDAYQTSAVSFNN